ncbi:Serine acetyltransferase 2 [Capsicum annuum]|nr:Serine acetyltransferase 2 [Capsicum annuum]
MQEALKQTTRELRRQLKFVPPRPLGVTLGGTGKETRDRHPKIGQGALIRASVTILGNIKVGEGAMVGADSLVMKDVPPHSTVTGIPAKVIGYVDDQDSSLTMKHDASKNFFLKLAISCKEARFNGEISLCRDLLVCQFLSPLGIIWCTKSPLENSFQKSFDSLNWYLPQHSFLSSLFQIANTCPALPHHRHGSRLREVSSDSNNRFPFYHASEVHPFPKSEYFHESNNLSVDRLPLFRIELRSYFFPVLFLGFFSYNWKD